MNPPPRQNVSRCSALFALFLTEASLTGLYAGAQSSLPIVGLAIGIALGLPLACLLTLLLRRLTTLTVFLTFTPPLIFLIAFLQVAQLLNPLTVGLGALAIGLVLRWSLVHNDRSTRHTRANTCATCGYSRRGLARNLCPECGASFDH